MATFGPISSIFDVLTFWVLLVVIGAGHTEFRTGWFVESLATQTLVIYVIRTRRVPFLRSRPSRWMLVVPLATAAAGAVLPFTPAAHALGFTPLPAVFLGILAGMIVTYLLLVEVVKAFFYRRQEPSERDRPSAHERRRHHRRRRASRFVLNLPQTRGAGAAPAEPAAAPSVRPTSVSQRS